MNLSELTDQVLRLSGALADQDKLIRALESRIEELESTKLSLTSKTNSLNVEDATHLFWVCTPIQHAFIQLILSGYKNQEVADRLDTSLASIKTRFRHLCGRLKVKGRTDLEINYKSIFDESDIKLYRETALIPKNWANEFGKLTFKQALKKDPFHKVICETNYRGITMS